jgi:hypothetical protein
MRGGVRGAAEVALAQYMKSWLNRPNSSLQRKAAQQEQHRAGMFLIKSQTH